MPVRNKLPRIAACCLITLALMSSGCFGRVSQTTKIGLVAPFEGPYREIGYDVIPAARLAIREWAATNKNTKLAIELVAYDDGGDPELAAAQARKLIVDPGVKIVIGHWRDGTTQAALPVYSQAELPLITFSSQEIALARRDIFNLAPSGEQLREAASDWLTRQGKPGALLLDTPADVSTSAAECIRYRERTLENILIGGPEWALGQFYGLSDGKAEGVYFVSGATAPQEVLGEGWSTEQLRTFIAGYQEGSLGATPGFWAVSAYQATWLAIVHIARTHSDSLGQTPIDYIQFGETGRRLDPPIYIYIWQEGQSVLVEQIR